MSEVTEIANNPGQHNEFLLGEEPTWADLQSGRAITREADSEIRELVRVALERQEPRVMVVTGTEKHFFDA